MITIFVCGCRDKLKTVNRLLTKKHYAVRSKQQKIANLMIQLESRTLFKIRYFFVNYIVYS